MTCTVSRIAVSRIAVSRIAVSRIAARAADAGVRAAGVRAAGALVAGTARARPRTLHRARRYAAVATAALALALAACAGADGSAADSGATPAVVGARTAIVRSQPFTETVRAIGTVEARMGHVAVLGAPAAGRVERVLVAAGQRVTAGQPLIVLDASAFAAEARSAAADVEAARQDAARTARLVREGISPRRDAEQAAAGLERAHAALVTARRQERLSTIRSPIAGVVTRLSTTLGATADPSRSLVEVADPSALDIVFTVSPADAARISAGAAVRLRELEHSAGDPPAMGTVVDVGAAVDSVSRGVPVRARLPEGAAAARIGQTMAGEITLAVRPAAIVVPLEALVPAGDSFLVYVVDDAGIARARAVSVGARADSTAEITRGLDVGSRIVTYGAYGIADGTRVDTTRLEGTRVDSAGVERTRVEGTRAESAGMPPERP